jgi:hypothetical protein
VQFFGSLFDSGCATAGIDAMSELIDAIGPVNAVVGQVQDLQDARDSLRNSLRTEQTQRSDELKSLAAWKDSDLNDWTHWPFARRLEGYRAAAAAWASVAGEVNPDHLTDDLTAAAEASKAADFGDADRDGAGAIYRRAMEAAEHQRAFVLWDKALSADQAMLAQANSTSGAAIALPKIPCARLANPPTAAFAPATAEKLVARIQERRRLWTAAPIAPLNAEALAQRLRTNEAALAKYLADYATGWEGALALEVAVPPDFQPQNIEGATIALKELGERVRQALKVLPPEQKDVAAALADINAGESAPADLEGRGKRLLGDWAVAKINTAGYHNESWQRELRAFDSEGSNYAADYWKGVAHSVGRMFDLMDRNPGISVTVEDGSDLGAPPESADDMKRIHGLAMQINGDTSGAVESNPIHSIKLNEGLDVRLQDPNNPGSPDTAGSADAMAVVALLNDPQSVHSTADPSIWFVRLDSQQGRKLVLKLKFNP